MRLSVIAFSITALSAAACGDEASTTTDDPESSLPGDIENDPDPTAGGKADAWDYSNDPARLSQRLNYKLADLPKTGKLDKPVWKDRYPEAVGKAPAAWADTYWPTSEGSTNVRWNGSSEMSPLEKYDKAFNNVAGCATQPAQMCGDNAVKEWGEYFKCAGPAAKWHMQNFQAIPEQIDGQDNDNDGQKDECDDSDDEGAQGWWGLCHAWTPASLLEPEPQKDVVYNGVTFHVGDIKALIATVYDRNEALMLGGRCNSKEISLDNTTRSANDPCYDSNPGSVHVIITNFLGLNDSALAMDKTASIQVWNQPIVGYEVTKQDKVTATKANECVGATGSKWTFNTNAKDLYEVEMTVEYLVEGGPEVGPLGMEDYTRAESYHYVLEIGSRGKIIGGRYCKDSVNDHPDFLWAPLKVSQSSYGRNPNVDLTKIQMLLKLAFAAEPVVGGNAKNYENTTEVQIPDNSATGASAKITVPDTFTFKSVSVSFDIKHTWVGDLKVELMNGTRSVAVLHNNGNGNQQNLALTKILSASEAGTTAGKGDWFLKVVDNAEADTGSIKSFKLSFGL